MRPAANAMRAASANDPRRQRRDQGLAVRRLPALPAVERRLGLRNQVLNGDLLIALEARTHRGLDRERHFPVDRTLGHARAAPPLRRLVLLDLRAALRPFRRFLHPGRLVRRTRRQMLQPQDLVLLDSATAPNTWRTRITVGLSSTNCMGADAAMSVTAGPAGIHRHRRQDVQAHPRSPKGRQSAAHAQRLRHHHPSGAGATERAGENQRDHRHSGASRRSGRARPAATSRRRPTSACGIRGPASPVS